MAVDLTVSSLYAWEKSNSFQCLHVLETIEWE